MPVPDLISRFILVISFFLPFLPFHQPLLHIAVCWTLCLAGGLWEPTIPWFSDSAASLALSLCPSRVQSRAPDFIRNQTAQKGKKPPQQFFPTFYLHFTLNLCKTTTGQNWQLYHWPVIINSWKITKRELGAVAINSFFF